MDRRRFFSLCGLALFAGCTSGGSDQETPDETQNTPTPTATETASPTPTPKPDPASFEIVRIKGPSKVEIGQPFSFDIVVKNVGEQSGTLRTELYRKTAGDSWQSVGKVNTGSIEGGATVEMSTEKVPINYLTEATYRVGNYETTYSVQTVSKSLEWGRSYTTPDSYEITVQKPEVQESYEYKNYSNDIEETRPESGSEQWAFLNVSVSNNSGEPAYSPVSDDFVILSDGSQYNPESLVFDTPINKGNRFEGGELQPGVTRSGWVLYTVPLPLSVEDMTVAWSDSTFTGDLSVNWSSNPSAPGEN